MRRRSPFRAVLSPLRGCAVALGLVACAPASAPTDPPALDDAPTVATAQARDDLKIHAVRTGFVRVKQAHRELGGPAAFRFPAIIGDKEWADWMPIVVYVIEHPDGIVVVDTGPSPQINDEGYWSCDKRSEWFYTNQLKFSLPPGESLQERLEQLQIDPADVTDVVISHFHGDHIGGIELFADATIHVGPGNWPKHTGAVPCVLPTWFGPTIARYDDGPLDVFSASLALSTDRAVSMVPLPGHTPGHAGVMVTAGDHRWLIVGDATFDRDQTDRGAVCGASQDVKDARDTQALLREQLAAQNTVLLPAHDPSVFRRL